jgi:ASC-1-like (ASCH) protein
MGLGANDMRSQKMTAHWVIKFSNQKMKVTVKSHFNTFEQMIRNHQGMEFITWTA